MFMPPRKMTYRNWDFLGDSEKIFWIDKGYTTETWKSGEDPSLRRGLMRIRVNNAKPTVLKKNLHALAWTVTYATFENPKFGFNLIKISPGSPSERCFGHLYSGCDFNPLASIQSSGISIKKVCLFEMPGGQVIGYRLGYPGKSSVLARIEKSYGSGGSSTDIAIDFLADSKNVCDYDRSFLNF